MTEGQNTEQALGSCGLLAFGAPMVAMARGATAYVLYGWFAPSLGWPAVSFPVLMGIALAFSMATAFIQVQTLNEAAQKALNGAKWGNSRTVALVAGQLGSCAFALVFGAFWRLFL